MERRRKMKYRKQICKIFLLTVFAAILAVIAGVAVSHLKEDAKQEQLFEEIREQSEEGSDEDLLSKLKKQNSDVIGYLEIPDTTISYPVMQTKEQPDFYLNHDFNRKYSFYGTPYLSASCDLKKSDNLIIYGHNINGGRMFGALTQYRDESFYKKYKDIFFTTESKDKYEIFAVMSVNKNVFPYWQFIMAQDEEDYNDFISKVKLYSIYDTGITPAYGDKLITISTCDNIRGHDYRFVVMGVRK